MEIPKELVEGLITEAKEDEVGLWLIIRTLRDELGLREGPAIKDTTLQCVQQLLETGEVVAGYYSGRGPEIARWDMDIGAILSRIANEWDRLGREPNIGEIMVLVGK